MATQERVQRQKTERKTETAEPTTTDQKKVDAEKLKADLDAILDEIDEVLESDAVATVRDFVQKGGQAVRSSLGALSRLWVPNARYA